jgi:homoserine dehydrogenase
MGDLIRIARAPGSQTRPRGLSETTEFLAMDDHICQYYTRLVVQDKPGVLAGVAGVLGSRGISIDSVIQMDSDSGRGVADIVLMSHPAREQEMQAAVTELAALEAVEQVASLLRVEDYPDAS